ncbi:MAG: hypothetical protein IT317_16375 [Anaerolineales bacterium]|nr:hypothetical protein [Anaerolineales bacterium]
MTERANSSARGEYKRDRAFGQPRFGTRIIPLRAGTRGMWRRHPANGQPEAWSDLLARLEQALRLADDHDLTLACEPEVANALDTAAGGGRRLDALRSPRLKVALDAANLFPAGALAGL